MENNKHYLHRFHWVFFSAVLYGFLYVLLIKSFSSGNNPESVFLAFRLIYFMYPVVLAVCLGNITGKWKEALISMALLLGIQFLSMKVLAGEFGWGHLLFSLLLSQFPLLLFLWLSWRQNGKIATNYLLIVLSLFILSTGYYSPENYSLVTQSFETSPVAALFFALLFRSISLGLQLVFLLEIVNLNSGHVSGWKPRLLNLGNQYPKTGSFLLFVFLNLGLPVLIMGASSMFNLYSYALKYDFGFNRSGVHVAQKINIFFSLCGIIASTLLYGWYYRKFMLEHFIHYNFQSKFLYWLNFIPVIGLLSFGIQLAEAEEQKTWNGKQASLSHFAGNNAGAVTAILGVILLLRFLLNLESSGPAAIIVLILSGVILAWFVLHPSGYYFSLYINLLALAALTVSLFLNTGIMEGRESSILFPVLLANLANIVYIMPVFHFSRFEYFPAEDPDTAETDENNLLGNLVGQP